MARGRQPIPHQFVGGIELKRCYDCKTFLPLDRFGKASASKNTSDGLRYECVECQSARGKRWRERCKLEGRQHKTGVPPGTRYLRVAYLACGGRGHVRLYRIWRAMRRRCYQTNHQDYPVYGGRGIRVCDEWNKSYDTFRVWAVSHGYAKELTLDRIRNAEGYGPGNCRWATREEQTYNSSRVHSLTLNGVTKLLPIWAKELGFTPFLLRSRRKEGWTDEQILTTPRLTNGQVRAGVQHQPRGRKPKSLVSREGFSADAGLPR